MNKMSIEECRKILGASADALKDAQIEALRDDYERIADVLFDQIVEQGREGLEAARWDTHFRLTGDGE